VSVLLNQAQTLFQSGERDAASATLVRAAQAYDHLGHFDNAAAIYRSLSQAYEAPLQVMLLWLKNCQRRDDRREAARVACELGDRALVDSDEAGAREWFERARAFDAENELADRRLQLMNAKTHENRTATVPGPTATPSSPETRTAAVVSSPARAPNRTGAEATSPAPRPGFVEISLQHEEPVGFDLGEMIAEFQRGLEEQLDSDPQGHYDLGMSYREMGLFEHAVLSFRTAARSSAFRVRASEMIGRCMLDQGDFDSAAAQLLETLGLPELSPGAAIDIHYQLGLALEAGGRLDEALGQFEQIYAAEANYPGVASKIRTLRKTLEKD
jgi:tetratricopeptide (TPR) repeat protein